MGDGHPTAAVDAAVDRTPGVWEAIADGFDRHTTPSNMAFAEQLLDRLDVTPGTRLLDVGTGSGALAIPAARRGADVVAVDHSPTMLERLRRRAAVEGLAGLVTRAMDGQDLQLDDGSVDVAASLNGVSILPDLARGLREMVRVTRAGGRVLVAAFGPRQRAECLTFLLSALQASVPGYTPPPTDPVLPPFRLADPAVFEAALQRAGGSDVHVDTLTWAARFDSARHFWDVVTHGHPTGRALVAGLSTDQVTDVQRVLAGMFRERSGGQPGAVLHTAMSVGTATA